MQPAIQEQNVWNGSPSQWLNFRTYLLSALAVLAIIAAMVVARTAVTGLSGDTQNWITIALICVLVIPIFIVLRAYLIVHTTNYAVTTQRVLFTRGIFSKQTDNLELYRVDDTQLLKPFLLRLVSRGNIHLVTSDRTNPQMILKAIPNSEALRDDLRQNVESCRDRKRTRVVDFVE